MELEPFSARFDVLRDDSTQFADCWDAGSIGEDELPKLVRLREATRDITDINLSDYVLLNFLRARDNKASKAEEMLRSAIAMMQSEQTMKCNLIEYVPVPVIQQYMPTAVIGFGRGKEPTMWHKSGMIDMAGLPRAVTRSDLIKYAQWLTCLLYSAGRAAGNLRPQKIEVFDLEGLGMDVVTSGTMGLMQEVMKYVELCTPEFVGKLVVINAPGFFTVLWTMLRPLMSAKTASKIVICGADYQETLNEIFEPDQIPCCYGGTMDALPNYFGRPALDKLIIPEEICSLECTNGETINVGRGSSHQVDIEVTEDDIVAGKRVLLWKFFSTDYDCGFGVYWKPFGVERLSKSDMEVIFPDKRYDCHICPQTDQVEVTKPGVYVIRFDNTYSYLHSKDVTFELELCNKVAQDYSTLGAFAEQM